MAIINPSSRQDECLGGGSAVPFLVWWVPRQLEASDLGCREWGTQSRDRTNLRNRQRQGRGAF